MLYVLFVLDGFIVGMTVFYLIELFFGNKLSVTFLKGILSLASGAAYTVLCTTSVESDVGIAIKLLAYFAPVCFIIIICLKDYIFKDI